jgi:hypothetical protein
MARQYMVILDFSLKRTFGNEPFSGEYSFYWLRECVQRRQNSDLKTHIDVVVERGVWRVHLSGCL